MKEESMKGLVVYYSEKGSNRYLARKIAEKSGFDLEEIRPRINGILPLILASLTKIGPGIRKMKSHIPAYDAIILCGPIWMGQFIYPLHCFVSKYGSQIGRMHFVTCCGGGDEQKDSKYGYDSVFNKVAGLLGGRFAGGFAIPIKQLVQAGAPQEDVLKTRLTEENFVMVEERFNLGMEGILRA